MDTVFTHSYKKISEVKGFKLSITESTERWICSLFKDSLGLKGERITVIDNYCEPYIILFDSDNNISTSKGSVDIYNKIISLTPKLHFLHRLPNIAIDVLQTCSHPVGLEVLSRIASVVHNKLHIR